MKIERRKVLEHLTASLAGAATVSLASSGRAAICGGTPTDVGFVSTSIGSGGPGSWTGGLGTAQGATEGETVVAVGAVTESDRAGGVFMWTCLLGSAADDYNDGGLFIRPTTVASGQPGRWVRIYSGPVDVRWFGAKGDGIQSDDAPIARAITRLYGSLPGAVGGVLRFSRGLYRVTATITLPRRDGMSLVGDGAMASTIQLDSAPATSPLLQFQTPAGAVPGVDDFHLAALRLQRNNRGYVFRHEAPLTAAGYGHTRMRRASLHDLFVEEQPSPATPTTSQPLVYLQNADDCIVRNVTFHGGTAGFLRIENGNGCLLTDLQSVALGGAGDAGAGLVLTGRALPGMASPPSGDHQVVRVRVEPLAPGLPSPREGVSLDGVRNCQLASVSVDGRNANNGIRVGANTLDTTILNVRAPTTSPASSAGIRLDGAGALILGLRYPDPVATGAQGVAGAGRAIKIGAARCDAAASLAASNASLNGPDYRMAMTDAGGNILGKRSSLTFAASGSTVVSLGGCEEIAITSSGAGTPVITNVHQGSTAADVAAPYEGQRVTLFFKGPVTVQNNALITLRDAADTTFAAGEILELTSDGGVWVESGRYEL